MSARKTNVVRPLALDSEAFGERVRQLRGLRSLTQTELAARMSVSVSYISKVENGKLHFGDYPSEKFIHTLAVELKADEDELLLLADKVPAAIRTRIRQRPELFRKLAKLDRQSLDAIEASLDAAN
ncbi:anaerobic benzoate catabolism transcriptional regulator [Rubripirellula lacrimiformis]|uniref:Anaerobic benzoate catabolism transcriptional regulator n=1 Tax=Rubripirellula lacrimiformis TaxID=1930273 RepID=A0A517NAR6_9BACT|nr:helix-turn-helix transcriptional regulator [Rubripirellula lacrimiformis]QDT04227.1 anaerobic benzoate catabolism transcriptional regulator [Rubripirellula lacrimiformis]